METNHVISIALAIICFAALLLFGLFSNILREAGNGTPYSFSKLQLWLWSIVIIPAFSLNWGFFSGKPVPPAINTTSLILLGISGGTALAAAAVSKTQQALPAPMPSKANLATQSFWTDILMDDKGQFSVTRLQQLLFTLVYIAIYLSLFFKNNAMAYPDFTDNSTYTLMGISTGTYVLGKSLNK
ncbi:MAG: hypothetical protein V4577_21075 [Bacteroidota bacterium]